MKATILIPVIALIGGGAFLYIKTAHTEQNDAMSHSSHGQSKATLGTNLTEPGQGAFAALSEIVRVLEANPETNWSVVDLTGLRAHLVDMDRLISNAVVEETRLQNGITARASGDADTLAALRRMVPAHAAQLAGDDRWIVTTSETENGVALRVISEDPAVVARIKGLGFFGLMASQDHHRRHHLMMALGKDAHSH